MGNKKGEKMMDTIKIYCNYGVLAAEKRKVYTYSGPSETATCWDEMTVEIPKGWKLGENNIGQTIVTAPWGWDYLIDEVLGGDDIPCFRAMDDSMRMHQVFLKTK